MNKMTLRDATIGDSGTLAELIYMTEDSPEQVWGYGSKDEIIERIKWLVESEDSRYSYNIIKVAELNTKICGAIILIQGNELSKLDIITSLRLIKLIKGIKNKIRFIKDIINEGSLDECNEKNELYIANLATFNEFRGKGVGKALIKLAEKTAKDQGYKYCSLLAKDKGVKSFYEKLDFVFKKEEEYFSHVVFKMIKFI